jgi:tRNA (guanine37-N1)-methyltransferase
MRFDVLTIFPELFPGPLGHGVIGRALERELIQLHAHNIRDHAELPHWQVDDEPFGGGAGMVFKPEPLARAIDAVRMATDPAGPVVFLSPQGEPLTHAMAADFATAGQLTLVCGRYEGIDQRIREHMIDREVSIGDYVVTGGELPAMVLIEAVARLVPEALGDPDSARYDSFVDGALDHPHFTRPASYRGWSVPEVLRSGDHARIAAWRRREALRATALRRPDLLANLELDGEERADVERCLQQGKSARENGPPEVD